MVVGEKENPNPVRVNRLELRRERTRFAEILVNSALITLHFRGTETKTYDSTSLSMDEVRHLSVMEEIKVVYLSNIIGRKVRGAGLVEQDLDVLTLMSGAGQIPNSNSKLLTHALEDSTTLFEETQPCPFGRREFLFAGGHRK